MKQRLTKWLSRSAFAFVSAMVVLIRVIMGIAAIIIIHLIAMATGAATGVLHDIGAIAHIADPIAIHVDIKNGAPFDAFAVYCAIGIITRLV